MNLDFKDVKSIEIKEGDVKSLSINGQVVWGYVEPVNSFYIEDVSGRPNTLSLTKSGDAPAINLEYSTDGNVWEKWFNCQSTTLPIAANSKVYLRGTNNVFTGNYISDTNCINCTKEFNVGGDITTLLTPEGNVLNLSDRKRVFYSLFSNSKVTDASQLILPSTRLSSDCYGSMFHSCPLLTAAPELPATQLVSGCYDYIFYYCSKLNYVKVGATVWNTSSIYWLEGVAPTGTFVKPKELKTWSGNISTKPKGTILLNSSFGIPTGWTVQDV